MLPEITLPTYTMGSRLTFSVSFVRSELRNASCPSVFTFWGMTNDVMGVFSNAHSPMLTSWEFEENVILETLV